MSELVRADLLVLRRRPLWWWALGLPLVGCALALVLDLTGAADVDGGAAFVADGAEGIGLLVTLMAILVGARLGSEDRAAGTLRYQLLTGVSRTRLVAAKLVVLLGTTVLMTALTVAGLVAVGLVLGGEALDTETLAEAAWNVLLPAVVYGTIALGVGVLVGATGPAIALALGLSLVGVQLFALLTLIDASLKAVVLPYGIDRLTTDLLDSADRLSFVGAVVVVVVWPAVAVLLGWLRLRRLEA